MKKAMVINIFVIITLFTGTSCAVAMRCEKYEYAQLKDMDREQLNITYCGLKIFYYGNSELIKGGNTSPDLLRDFNECGDQMMKALHAFKAKYKKLPTDCDKLPRY